MKSILVILGLMTILYCDNGCIKKNIVDPDPDPNTKDSINKSIKFDGVRSYLQVQDAGDLRLCASNYTIETWAYFNYIGGDWQVLLAKDNKDNNTEFLLTYDAPTNKFRFQTRDFSTVLYSLQNVVANRWYHIAAVQDTGASTVKLYINGVLESTKTLSGRVVSTEYPIRFGTRINDITAGSPWYVVNGFMDETRIWNIAKSESQIKASMNSQLKGNESGLVACWSFDDSQVGYATDITGHGHRAQFINSPVYSIKAAPLE